MTDSRPIGVFDSGVGGLTVLSEILRRSPHESTIYLGDNARAPYGVRTDEEVRTFSRQALDNLAANAVKAIVVACNTASAVALTDHRRRYDVPVLGVIRPGATAAALATRTRHVGVIATPTTVRSHAYFEAIKDENPVVEVYEHATPALVPLVEAGELNGSRAQAVVADALAPLLGRAASKRRSEAGSDPLSRSLVDREFVFPMAPTARIDTLLLGCTHYPLLRSVIEVVAGPEIALVDSATATAGALAEILSINGLEAPPDTVATHRQFTTGDVGAFRALADRLFGAEFADVDSIDLAVAS